jgi:hypothetical protein
VDRNGVRQVFRDVRPRNWIGGFTRTFRCRILRSPDGYPPLQRGPPFQKVIRPNSSAISSAQSDVSIRFVAGGAPSVPFGAEVAIDVGVFFSSATLAELWTGSLAFRFRVSLLPSVPSLQRVLLFRGSRKRHLGGIVRLVHQSSGLVCFWIVVFVRGNTLRRFSLSYVADIANFTKQGRRAFFKASSFHCLRLHKVRRGRCPFRSFRCRSDNRRWRLLLVDDLSGALDRVTRVPLPCSPFAFFGFPLCRGVLLFRRSQSRRLGGSFGSIPDLPADFAPGSSSYSIDALFTIEFRVIAEIFSDFRKPGAGAFFSASSSFCLHQNSYW